MTSWSVLARRTATALDGVTVFLVTMRLDTFPLTGRGLLLGIGQVAMLVIPVTDGYLPSLRGCLRYSLLCCLLSGYSAITSLGTRPRYGSLAFESYS